MGTQLPNEQKSASKHEEEILKAYHQGAKRSMRYFGIVTCLSAMLLFAVSLIFLIMNNKDVAFLLLSTSVSLFVTLLFTVYYATVVDSALRQSESKAQS